MSDFIPTKLVVDMKKGIAITEPLTTRKYTLTHSDETGELFLSVGKEYDYDKIQPIRDDVLANWIKDNDKYILDVIVQVDGSNGMTETIKKNKIFRQELPLALKAIIYGDKLFIEAHPELNDAQVRINFKSKFPEYNVVENFGAIKDYKVEAVRYNDLQGNLNYREANGTNDSIESNKSRDVISKALISILNPYIKNEVSIEFGPNAPYCLKSVEILESKSVNNYGPCSEEYEVTIGLKVGRNIPLYNNMIITFLISNTVVKVMSVKNPK